MDHLDSVTLNVPDAKFKAVIDELREHFARVIVVGKFPVEEHTAVQLVVDEARVILYGMGIDGSTAIVDQWAPLYPQGRADSPRKASAGPAPAPEPTLPMLPPPIVTPMPAPLPTAPIVTPTPPPPPVEPIVTPTPPPTHASPLWDAWRARELAAGQDTLFRALTRIEAWIRAHLNTPTDDIAETSPTLRAISVETVLRKRVPGNTVVEEKMVELWGDPTVAQERWKNHAELFLHLVLVDTSPLLSFDTKVKRDIHATFDIYRILRNKAIALGIHVPFPTTLQELNNALPVIQHDLLDIWTGGATSANRPDWAVYVTLWPPVTPEARYRYTDEWLDRFERLVKDTSDTMGVLREHMKITGTLIPGNMPAGLDKGYMAFQEAAFDRFANWARDPSERARNNVAFGLAGFYLVIMYGLRHKVEIRDMVMSIRWIRAIKVLRPEKRDVIAAYFGSPEAIQDAEDVALALDTGDTLDASVVHTGALAAALGAANRQAGDPPAIAWPDSPNVVPAPAPAPEPAPAA